MQLRAYTKEDAKTICSWIRSEEELYRWSADQFNKFPLQAEDMEAYYAPRTAEGNYFPLVMTDEQGKPVGHFIIRHPGHEDATVYRFGFIVVDPEIRGTMTGQDIAIRLRDSGSLTGRTVRCPSETGSASRWNIDLRDSPQKTSRIPDCECDMLIVQEAETMKEWAEVVQQMIEWMELHPDRNRILEDLSDEIGYSPWYCSVVFHDVTGMTMKSYASGRRLARAAEEIRDTKERILDIAVKNGYSSQEAMSRVFKEQFGCTPAAYRRKPVPIPLLPKKTVLFPDITQTERIKKMEEARLDVRVEYIPAHKYLGIWEERAENYCDFWKYHDCDTVCGYVTSMDKSAHPIVTAHTAGWKLADGKRTYFY